jgi:2-haloacid dehalogenase
LASRPELRQSLFEADVNSADQALACGLRMIFSENRVPLFGIMLRGHRMTVVVKALFFDVFGTLVDWRTSIAREAETMLKPRGFALDWLAFADAWRGEYQGAMDGVRTGRTKFCKLDVLHRRNLELILPRFGLGELSQDDLGNLNMAWHRLDAWPDVARGLARLKRRYLIAPVSNGNISMMVDLARRNGLLWDAILGAEVAGDYKPKPQVYRAAAAAFDLAPQDCMMVAAHSNDLKSAAALGLHTGHVARPDERGRGCGEAAPNIAVDVAVHSVEELAEKLGA